MNTFTTAEATLTEFLEVDEAFRYLQSYEAGRNLGGEQHQPDEVEPEEPAVEEALETQLWDAQPGGESAALTPVECS